MITTNGSGAALAAVVEQAALSYFRYFGRLPGAELIDNPQITWFVTGIPLDFFNGVARASLDYQKIDQTIESSLDEFRGRGLPMLWHTGPSTRPVDLGSHLVNHGMLLVEEEPGMAYDFSSSPPADPLPADLTFQTVVTARNLDEWVRVWAGNISEHDIHLCRRVFRQLGLEPGRPLQLFLARQQNIPVATAAIYYTQTSRGLTASIQHVVTDETFRQQGIGTAIVRHVVHTARLNGAQMAVLTASAMGIGIYHRLGFRICGDFLAYAWNEKYT
jgi:ribosomal protein S18 acetylase RimI-like enzyme